MEVIYLNCGYRREYESDLRSNEHYLSSGFIWNQHSDQLPLGLLAELIEHCTGIAEVMGSNPVQAFFSLLLKQCSDRRRSLSYSKITSKKIGKGTNCSSLSLSSLEILQSLQLFSKMEVTSGTQKFVSNHKIEILMVICNRKQHQALGERFSPC